MAAGGWLFVSGQGPIDMTTRRVVHGAIEEETRRTLQNIRAILAEAGAGLEDVVKCACHLADLKDFAGFDAVYREFFTGPVPLARTTVGSALLGGIRIEIDVVAILPESRRTR